MYDRLDTHADVEPFVIATNRHISVVHPIHKLLPQYRDTMNINSLARLVLDNGDGIKEQNFCGDAVLCKCLLLHTRIVF